MRPSTERSLRPTAGRRISGTKRYSKICSPSTWNDARLVGKGASKFTESWLVCCYSACSPIEVVLGRNHSETCAGCIVSFTTPTRWTLNALRSVSSRNWAEKASRVTSLWGSQGVGSPPRPRPRRSLRHLPRAQARVPECERRVQRSSGLREPGLPSRVPTRGYISSRRSTKRS
jgi:hypothetical protein